MPVITPDNDSDQGEPQFIFPQLPNEGTEQSKLVQELLTIGEQVAKGNGSPLKPEAFGYVEDADVQIINLRPDASSFGIAGFAQISEVQSAILQKLTKAKDADADVGDLRDFRVSFIANGENLKVFNLGQRGDDDEGVKFMELINPKNYEGFKEALEKGDFDRQVMVLPKASAMAFDLALRVFRSSQFKAVGSFEEAVEYMNSCYANKD